MPEFAEMNPYTLYNQQNLLNSNPVELVVALYQGAIDSIGIAKECLQSRDIPGRTKAINKAYNIVTELLASLNHEKGGQISKNLAGLYAYMLKQILEAHLKQQAQPLDEVKKLLTDLLEAWRQASSKYDPFAVATLTVGSDKVAAAVQQTSSADESNVKSEDIPYGSYMFDYGDLAARQAYSF